MQTPRILDFIRTITPLPLRRKFGPAVGYVVYLFRIYIAKNRDEPRVLSIEDTLDLVIRDKLSLVRFGDGEISLIQGINLKFQNTDEELGTRLKQILQSNEKGLLICISGFWNKLDMFTKEAFLFNLHHLLKYRHVWLSLLPKNKIYGDAYLTRPYLFYKKDRIDTENIFKKLQSLWENKNVVLIEGEKARNGVGNNLFDNVKTLHRILCPAENAYSQFDTIMKHALTIDKSVLILVSLGPTAKPITYAMHTNGYRVLDIGHIDMEYEMFIRKKEKIIKIQHKYFNEIDERNPEECNDEKYLSQIIATIT